MEAYPLYWPEGWKRTDRFYRETSKFKSSFARARDELLEEIERLRGRYSREPDPILSTNVSLRLDGLPYANQREPDDPGVAVYFRYKDKDMCFACDKYKKVWENMVGIRKTIEAIRGIERWGASDMMERAFKGFVALEHGRPWQQVLQVGTYPSPHEVDQSYKTLRNKLHPDKPGGSHEKFIELQEAFKKAQEYFNERS